MSWFQFHIVKHKDLKYCNFLFIYLWGLHITFCIYLPQWVSHPLSPNDLTGEAALFYFVFFEFEPWGGQTLFLHPFPLQLKSGHTRGVCGLDGYLSAYCCGRKRKAWWVGSLEAWGFHWCGEAVWKHCCETDFLSATATTWAAPSSSGRRVLAAQHLS